MSLLAPTLQAFFTERLITQRDSSPHTIASYRDTFRLLLAFAGERTGKQPCRLDIDDLDAPLIGAFLNHLEQTRGNSARTRNNRLAAIHAFCKYAALRHPEHLHTLGRVLAIPTKRYERNTVSYLQLEEIKALLAAPDRGTWLGRRDHALVLLAVLTGVRVAELITLTIGNVSLATGAHIKVTGKGRKRRTVTLTAEAVGVLREWLKERYGQPQGPALPHPPRNGAQPRRGRTAPRQTHRHREPRAPFARRQASHPAHTPPHQRNAAQSRQHRHHHDRAMARTREHQNHAHLRARRPKAQRTSRREDHPPRRQARPLPPLRRTSCVPTRPLIMPSDPPHNHR